VRGSYVDDPEQVAAAFRAIVGAGTSPRALALQVPAGKEIEAAIWRGWVGRSSGSRT